MTTLAARVEDGTMVGANEVEPRTMVEIILVDGCAWGRTDVY